MRINMRLFRAMELFSEADAAWRYASMKGPDSMAGDMAESAAIEAEEEALRLLSLDLEIQQREKDARHSQ